MKLKIIVSLFIASLLAAFNANAQSHIKYFGYYYNSGFQHETNPHTNITMVVASLNLSEIHAELVMASNANVSVILLVEPFLFVRTNTGVTRNPEAANNWAFLTQYLVNNEFLVPENPASGTVVAFYPVDEPELQGLTDKFDWNTGWGTDPILAEAVNIIRTHPHTTNTPIAVIASNKYMNAKSGLQLFDWIGYDNYSLSDFAYLHLEFENFKRNLNITGHQRTILVPQASIIYDRKTKRRDETLHSADAVYQKAISDISVVMIMPFLWRSVPDTDIGTHSILGLRESAPVFDPRGVLDRHRPRYENIGRIIKYRLF